MSRVGTAPATGGKGPGGPFLAGLGAATLVLDWSGRVIAVICLAFMFVLLLLNVVLRYTAGEGIAWAYEIHALLLPWLVAGGIVIAAARGRNIAITILPDLLGPERTRWLMLAVHLAIMVICLSVLWSSQPILKAAQFQKLATLGIKQVWGYSSLAYAFGGMALIALFDSLRLIAGERPGQTELEKGSLS